MTAPSSPPPADPDDLLTGASEIAKFFKCNERRAYYMLRTEQVPAFQLGRKWHARRSTLTKFFEEQEQRTPGAGTKSSARE